MTRLLAFLRCAVILTMNLQLIAKNENRMLVLGNASVRKQLAEAKVKYQ